MTSYLVEWRIDIEADSPEQAATLAWMIQQDKDSQADHFEVTDPDGNTFSVNALDDERNDVTWLERTVMGVEYQHEDTDDTGRQ